MGKHSWNEDSPDYIYDAEFVPEDADQPLNKPEWRVFLYYGRAKFDAAVDCLRFVALRDGLYHYEDRRDGTPYTMPEIDTVKAFVKGTRRCEVENEEIYSRIQRVSWALGIMTIVTCFAAAIFDDETGPVHQQPLANFLWVVFILLLTVGPLGLGIARSVMRHDPQPLPRHRMFRTDAEIAEEQRRKAQREMMAAAATAVFVANEYRKHNNRQLAEEIAKAQYRQQHRGGPSQWPH